MDKGKNQLKNIFSKNTELFLIAREKTPSNIRIKIFLTKNPYKILTPDPTVFDTHKPTKEQTNKSSSKQYGNLFNKITNDETKINTGLFN